MEFYDRINARRSRLPLNEELAQDLGDGFQFSEDADALQSILSNVGISQAQRQAMTMEALASSGKLTPAKVLDGQASDEKFEFYQGKGGHVFFRRKVGAPTSTKHYNAGSQRPLGERNDGHSSSGTKDDKFKPIRFGGSGKKTDPFAPSSRKENSDPHKSNPAMSEKKKRVVEMFVAPHRQSISEKKPVRRRSQLPQKQPAAANPTARKGLDFAKSKDVFKKPFTPHAENKIQTSAASKPATDFPLEPLRRLDRDSIKFLPRDSLAWISHLPRDSATFLELEKLMHEKDKDLLREDDTGSFEAMELRLKTPRKFTIKPMSHVAQETQNEKKSTNRAIDQKNEQIDIDDPMEEDESDQNSSLVHEDSNSIQGTFFDLLNSTPSPVFDKERFKVRLTLTPTFTKEEKQEIEMDKKKEFTPKSDFIKGDLLEEFNNMPTNAKLATPTTKSKSMTNLAVDEDQLAQVHRSVSEEQIKDGEQVSSLVSVDLLQKALQEMEDMRREQEELERAQLELFNKIRERKQAFKNIWGVSPMSVNKTRTVIVNDAKSINPESSKNTKSTVVEDTKSNTPEVIRANSISPGNVEHKISAASLGDDRNNDLDDTLEDTFDKGKFSMLQSPSLEGFSRLAGTPETAIQQENPAVLNTEMKKVRFNSGENRAKYLTPDFEVTFKRSTGIEKSISPPLTLTPAIVKPTIDEQAKHARRSFNNQSFVSLKSSFAFLQTPGNGGTKTHQVTEQNQQSTINKGVPTPMALKSLSARVKEEYALLYADDDDEQSEEENNTTEIFHQQADDIIKKLNF